jgi:hypothetical protein
MRFRMQDLLTDVLPGRSLELANDRCTCAASANPGALREPGTALDGTSDGCADGDLEIPGDDPVCQDTLLPEGEYPSDARSALVANLVALKAQLRRDLGAGA